MKNFLRLLTAIFTAAVMTVSAAGTVFALTDTASADENAAPKYTGWVSDENGWQYLSEGIPCTSGSLRIDGVYYRFSLNGYCIGTVTGWSGKRYYRGGLPHTGWLGDGKDRQYCLNGYPVTGDFQIEDTVYSFDRKGIYTGESEPAVMTASCAEAVSVDAEKISIIVKHNGGSREYLVGNPEKMERWENGKWKRCGKSSKYAVDDIGMIIDGTDDCSPNSAAVAFYPNRYMGGDMPAGYYRIAVPCGESNNYSKTKKDVYAVFKAVPAVKAEMSEQIYIADSAKNTAIGITANINSEKDTLKAEKIINSIKLEVQEKTVSGWETCENFGYAAGYPDKENKIEISGEFFPGTGQAGYYRAVLNAGGKDYITHFRIDNIWATPWLDEYSLKSDDITVSFNVRNRYEKPVNICDDLLRLFKKENGEWTDMWDTAGRFDCVEIDPSYTALEKGRTTMNFDLSKYYDTSKLTEGDYAVLIDGIGYAGFRLADDEPSVKELPFKDLKSEDIKEIQLIYVNSSMDVKTVLRGGSGKITNTVSEEDQYGSTKATAVVKDDKQLERVIDYLRQFRLGEAYTKKDTYCGGTVSVVVRYKNNTKKTLDFTYSEIATYNGRSKYNCDEMLYLAADDIIEETNKEYYAGLGLA